MLAILVVGPAVDDDSDGDDCDDCDDCEDNDDDHAVTR
jgi:hypothetical protein